MKIVKASGNDGLDVSASGYIDGHMACWFSLPRAMEADGRTFIGGVQSLTLTTMDGYNNPWSTVFSRNHEGGDVITIECGVEKKYVNYNSYSDDHNNPSYLFFDDKPPVVFITQHNADDEVIYRKGSTPLDLTTLGEPQMLDYSTVGPSISYAQVWRKSGSDRVICFTRLKGLGDGPLANPKFWALAVSEDYCETWTNKRDLIDFGDQGYIMSNLAADGKTIHIGGSMHPSRNFGQSLLYFSIDLDDGSIKKRDGTVLGNIDGTNLPLHYANDTDSVFPVSEPNRVWIKDVGPNGSLVWAQWNENTESMTGGNYRHARWEGGQWVVSTIVDSGGVFGNYPLDEDMPTQTYRGGASIDQNGDVFLSRKHPSGIWAIERWSLDNDSWVLVETLATSNHRLARPYCPVNRVSGPRVIWHEVYEYTTPGLFRCAVRWDGQTS